MLNDELHKPYKKHIKGTTKVLIMLSEQKEIVSNEQRKYPRYPAQDLNAVIVISPPPPDESISIAGTVMDMSRKGIKIKLTSALPQDIPVSKILINVKMPKSGLTFKISGSIRHINEKAEYGINYDKEHSEDELDNLMFECIKI